MSRILHYSLYLHDFVPFKNEPFLFVYFFFHFPINVLDPVGRGCSVGVSE